MQRSSFCWLVAVLAGFSLANAFNTEPGRLGCYEDNGARVWKQWFNTHEKNTAKFCRNMCQDFKFAGMELGYWCMCGDEIPPKALPDSRCNSPCSGDPAQTCGGAWALEVWPVETKPVLVGEHVGCFQDAAVRIWKNGLILLQSNSPQRCFNSCRGHKFAGVEAGAWCMCGDSMPLTPLPMAMCQMDCVGYWGKKCGGLWALDVYEIHEEEPKVQVTGYIPLEYQSSGDLGVYKLFAQRKTWDEAWQQCEDDDAHLLIINSEEEAKFVRSLFAQVPSETRMHAGFHDLLRKGTYRTLFGDTLTSAGYNKWSAEHAQSASSVQHCGCVDRRAQLAQIDGNCGTKAVFVCEKKSDSPDTNGAAYDFDVRGAITRTLGKR